MLYPYQQCVYLPGHLVIKDFLIFAYLVDVKYLIVVFICIGYKEVEYVFMCLFSILISSFVICLFMSFYHLVLCVFLIDL